MIMIKTYKCYHDFHNYILIFSHLLSSIDTAIKGLHNQVVGDPNTMYIVLYYTRYVFFLFTHLYE